jgi:dTDP-4-amino-4,6-dideoxygalactose transaminase
MTVPFLNLRRQVEEIRGDLDRAVSNVLDSGRFLGGPTVEEFEDAFARYCGAAHAVGLASGTDAIAIALRATGIRARDEVLVPANTCVPTVAGVEAAGARPVLVDVDPRTYTIDPERLEASIGPRSRAVVPVHLYGQCANMDSISSVAKRHGLVVVEDAAHAHGAAYRGRLAGTLGDAAAFSFYPTKNLGAVGDAGAVVTNDPKVAARARMLRTYGEDERYRSLLSGTNSRLDTLQAAVLLVKLRRLDEWTERRRRIAGAYREALSGSELELPVEADGRSHVYHLFVVRVADRDRFRASLSDAGVETLVHYPRPIHGHPAYANLADDHNRLTVSEQLAREVVSLPLHPHLTETEIDDVARLVRAAAARVATER